MTSHCPLELIQKRIVESDKGTVFVSSDFKDIDNSVNIRKSLSRLAKNGLIRRVMRGVYEYPKFSSLLGEYVAPSPHNTAMAIARNYGWTAVPCGNTALNQTGLSTQVPAKWEYVSDGPNKEYSYSNVNIRFRHTANKNISQLSYKTALMVQAIKAIGQKHINNTDIKRLSLLLSPDERTAILSEGKYATAWVYSILKKIGAED